MVGEGDHRSIKIPSMGSVRATIGSKARWLVHLFDKNVSELSIKEAEQLVGVLGDFSRFAKSFGAEVSKALTEALEDETRRITKRGHDS